MAKQTLSDLLRDALPEDMTLAELMSAYSEYQCPPLSMDTVATALRKNRRINWRAYVANNQEVLNARISPIKHFLQHGLYEGGKLWSHHPLKMTGKRYPDAPKVSVVIPNYNNALYLSKCLESLIGQTLKKIEIIIVDDNSQDDSREIITAYMRNDSRIKMVSHSLNLGTHMSRKSGVFVASGDYVMFLDPDDYYMPFACEIAWKYAIKGYDIVDFNLNVISHTNLTPDKIKQAENWYNRYASGIYPGTNLLNTMIVDRSLFFPLCNKIFDRYVCLAGFELTENCHLKTTEDLYEFMAISLFARSFLKVEDKLYCYNRGVGGSCFVQTSARAVRGMHNGKIIDPLQTFINKYGLDHYTEHIRWRAFESSLYGLDKFKSIWIKKYIQRISKYYGILYTVKAIMRIYLSNPGVIINQITRANMAVEVQHEDVSAGIGIVCSNLSDYSNRLLLNNICVSLLSHGYHITIIVSGELNSEVLLPSTVELKQITQASPSVERESLHLEQLFNVVQDSKIKYMLFTNTESKQLIWDILLLNLLDIHVIGLLASNYPEFLEQFKDKSFAPETWMRTLQCLDKLVCASRITELNLRLRDICAESIPGLFQSVAGYEAEKRAENSILAFTDGANGLHRPEEIMKIFREVLKQIPDARLYVRGEFKNNNQRQVWNKWLCGHKLQNSVQLVENDKDAAFHISVCNVMLSTAYPATAANDISLARALAIPWVAYGFPGLNADSCTDGIVIARGNYIKAAREIVNILLNQSSLTTRIKASRSCQDSNATISLAQSLKDTGRLCRPAYYTKGDYINAINMTTFYAGRTIPSVWPVQK